MVMLGALLGSLVAASARKEFRVESFHNAADMGNHLAGAVLMGFSGVTAMGRTIGHGISGLSMLSAGSCIAVAGIVAGAWLALRFQVWKIERSDT